MPDCTRCNHRNPPGADRCDGCGAWLVQGDPAPPDPEAISTEEDLESQLRHLLEGGRKIEAIKLYRDVTGAGLQEAKEAVDTLQHGGWLPYEDPLEEEPLETEFEEQLADMVKRGEKISAIKLYRERTGAGLDVAKDAVEAIARKHGFTPKATGCAGVVALGFVSCAALIGKCVGLI